MENQHVNPEWEILDEDQLKMIIGGEGSDPPPPPPPPNTEDPDDNT